MLPKLEITLVAIVLFSSCESTMNSTKDGQSGDRVQNVETPSKPETEIAANQPGSGSEVGNGGDSWALDFVSFSQRIVEELSRMSVDQRMGLDPVEIGKTLAKTKVESTSEKLFINGFEKTAVNF